MAVRDTGNTSPGTTQQSAAHSYRGVLSAASAGNRDSRTRARATTTALPPGMAASSHLLLVPDAVGHGHDGPRTPSKGSVHPKGRTIGGKLVEYGASNETSPSTMGKSYHGSKHVGNANDIADTPSDSRMGSKQVPSSVPSSRMGSKTKDGKDDQRRHDKYGNPMKSGRYGG